MRLKHWIKQNTTLPPTSQTMEGSEAPISDVSIDRLLDQGLVSLSREMRNLLTLSANGKLQPADARDLRDHVRLLFELKERENELLKGLTDEDLMKVATDADKQDSRSSGDGQP